jgi:hypothetical protein
MHMEYIITGIGIFTLFKRIRANQPPVNMATTFSEAFDSTTNKETSLLSSDTRDADSERMGFTLGDTSFYSLGAPDPREEHSFFDPISWSVFPPPQTYVTEAFHNTPS